MKQKSTNENSDRGASAVEFALLAPILLLMVFGAVEFGRAFWYKQELVAAVREGARAGIIQTSPRPTAQFIHDKIYNYLVAQGMSAATVPTPTPCSASGATLTVTASYPVSTGLLSNLQKLVGGSSAFTATRTLTSSVSMQCE